MQGLNGAKTQSGRNIATIAWDVDGVDGVDGVDTLKQTRREKGRVTRKRLQDTPSRIPPQTPIPALLVSSSEHQIFPYFSSTNLQTRDHHDTLKETLLKRPSKKTLEPLPPDPILKDRETPLSRARALLVSDCLTGVDVDDDPGPESVSHCSAWRCPPCLH